MKRLLMASAGLAVVGLALAALAENGRSQGQPYPIPGMGGQGSTLNQPWLPTSPAPTRGRPSQVPEEWKAVHEDPSMNRDILVGPEQGPWLIYVTSYSGPKGPSMARELVGELRGGNYRLPAFVFNYGEKERREELERVRQEVERRRAALRKEGLSADIPMRVPRMRVEVEIGVLIGGYKDFDAARADLKRIKNLPPLDPNRVKLPGVIVGEVPGGGPSRATGPKVSIAPINIFVRALVVRNPSVPQDQLANQNPLDLAVLQRLNADEGLSLLRCRKQYTLAVKHFALPTTLEQKSTLAGFWGKVGLGGNKSDKRADTAAFNAHNLAELLRRLGWEAYVLHTRYVSIVSVGGYDNPDEARLVHDQEALAILNEQRLARADTNVQQSGGQPPPTQLFPRAMPMRVPH